MRGIRRAALAAAAALGLLLHAGLLLACALASRKGQPIGSNDLLIAAHALALDLILVTDNVDEFARVPGLSIENWLAA